MAIEVYWYEPYRDSTSRLPKQLLYTTDNPAGYDFAPGVLKDEVNKAGSFEFDIYPEHPLYYDLKPFYTYIGVEDSEQTANESILFYGRIINMTIDMYGAKHVTCEGLLANLLDCPAYMPDSDVNEILSIKSQGTYWLFLYALTAYDELLNRGDIVFGNVDSSIRIMSDEMIEYKNSITQNCGDFIMSLLDTFGGIIETNYNPMSYRINGTLNWKTDPISEPNRFTINGQEFVFGENIISANFDTADSTKIGGIFPFGYCTIDGNEEVYYNAVRNSRTGHYMPLVINKYGSSASVDYHYPIKAAQIEGADTGNGMDGPYFKELSERYAMLHCQEYVNDVTINGVDEYFIGKAPRRIHIMDRVHVSVPYAQYDETKYCLSYELDIANPANSQFKFGDYKPISSQKAYYISTHISSKNK